jgi:hypothetical protein
MKLIHLVVFLLSVVITGTSACSAAEPVYMTPTGISAIHIGDNIHKIPPRIPGLYNKINKTKEFNEMEGYEQIVSVCYLDGKESLLIQADAEDAKITLILGSASTKAKIGTTIISVGDPISKVKKLSGARTDDYGSVYVGDDLFFYDEDGKVSNIGLGSPW